MDQQTPKNVLTGLAKCIVAGNLLNKDQVVDALRKSQQLNISFVTYLTENKLIDAKQLAITASKNFGVPLLNLAEYNFDFIPSGIVREDILKKHKVLPLYKQGSKLFVAITDPTDRIAIDEIKFSTGLNVNAVLVQTDLLNKFIEKIMNRVNRETKSFL